MHGDDSPLKFSNDSGITTRYRYGRRRCVPVFRDMVSTGIWEYGYPLLFFRDPRLSFAAMDADDEPEAGGFLSGVVLLES